MAKVLQIIDVDSEGHKIRLDNGDVVRWPHGPHVPHIGQELPEVSAIPTPKISALGQRLLELSAKALASGTKTLSSNEIHELLGKVRGGYALEPERSDSEGQSGEQPTETEAVGEGGELSPPANG